MLYMLHPRSSLPVLTAVHEDVVFPGVSVQITVYGDAVVVLKKFCYQSLDVIDGREGLLDSVLVLPVEICPGQVAPRVPHDHSVRVDHRDDLEDVVLSKRLGNVRLS